VSKRSVREHILFASTYSTLYVKSCSYRRPRSYKAIKQYDVTGWTSCDSNRSKQIWKFPSHATDDWKEKKEFFNSAPMT